MNLKDFERGIELFNREFKHVVDFDPEKEKLILLDFSEANLALEAAIIEDTDKFSAYIQNQLKSAGARFGIGGYDEHRTVYSRSRVFDPAIPGEEPRRLHLGTDIWGAVHTPVYAPLDAVVHSAAFNDHYGDYGATIILEHHVGGNKIYTLYGHLSLADIRNLNPGDRIRSGQLFCHFGPPKENGHWPPHLHFQIILDMEGNKGDYPGVCKYSEKERFLAKCPDPDLILNLNRFIS